MRAKMTNEQQLREALTKVRNELPHIGGNANPTMELLRLIKCATDPVIHGGEG